MVHGVLLMKGLAKGLLNVAFCVPNSRLARHGMLQRVMDTLILMLPAPALVCVTGHVHPVPIIPGLPFHVGRLDAMSPIVVVITSVKVPVYMFIFKLQIIFHLTSQFSPSSFRPSSKIFNYFQLLMLKVYQTTQMRISNQSTSCSGPSTLPGRACFLR